MATYDKFRLTIILLCTTLTQTTFLLVMYPSYNFLVSENDKLYYKVFFGLNDKNDNIYTGKLTTLPASNEFTVKYNNNVIDNIKIHIKKLRLYKNSWRNICLL